MKFKAFIFVGLAVLLIASAVADQQNTAKSKEDKNVMVQPKAEETTPKEEAKGELLFPPDKAKG